MVVLYQQTIHLEITALTRFFIEDVNYNEYWRDSSEPFWNDINTTITVTNPNDVVIDTTPPVLTSFEIVDTTLSVDEQFVINFNATGVIMVNLLISIWRLCDTVNYNEYWRDS